MPTLHGVTMRELVRVIALAVAVGVLFLMAPSLAAANTASVDDPQEAPPNLSGPKDPDVKHLTVSYSPKGALTVQAELWEPLTDGNSYLGITLRVSTGTMTPSTYDPKVSYCSGGLSASISLGSEYTYLTIPGFQGSLDTTSSRASADKRTFTYYYRHDALAGANPTCGQWGLDARVYSMSGSSYSSGCNCFPSTRTLDGSSNVGPALTFDASTPACDDGVDNDGDGRIDANDPGCMQQISGFNEVDTLPACDDAIDNDGDGTIDAKDPGCKGAATGSSEVDPRRVATKYSLVAKRSKCVIDTEVEALPDIKPVELFPFQKVVVEVAGTTKANRYKVTRKLPLARVMGYTFGPRLAGKFRVRSWYPGDKWRAKSIVRVKFVTLPASCARKKRS